jgi:hypothetical protein
VHAIASRSQPIETTPSTSTVTTDVITSIVNDGNELKSVTVVDGAMEGVPFAVLKTKCLDGTKVFINMCSNNAVMRSEILISTGCPHDIPDKSGEICIGYDACVSADVVSEETLRNEVLCGSFIFGC